jgi:conjugative relaxase-like TrwC/TraI family protein
VHHDAGGVAFRPVDALREGVLSTAKLAPGQEAYYLSVVADGVEEYYTATGEPPGRWLASSLLAGVDGEVTPEALHVMLGGVHPVTGEPLGRANRRVPGFDLTFSAPKSVSLLFALGASDVAEVVRDAHDQAVVAALGWLEGEACRVRRGHDGLDVSAGAGFVAAGFRHRTSRAGDPQLHTHVLVANATVGEDGQWSALDARPLFRAARTAGFLYQAELRAELSERLGVQWRPAVKGMAELAGVDPAVLREFSRRRVEIEAHVAERGVRGRRAGELAALETPRAKTLVDPAVLEAEWAARAAAHGIDRDALGMLVGLTAGLTSAPIADAELGRVVTASEATFDRRDVIRVVAEHATVGARIADVEGRADAFLASHEAVLVDTGRYTTPEILDLEASIIDAAVTGEAAGWAIVDEVTVARALRRRPTLAGEQAAMVHTLTRSGNAVDVVVGQAGAGKTFALAAAADAWRTRGDHVIGTALAARAALELGTGAGIPAGTLDRLLRRLEREPLQPRSVVIVDEAAMVGTRKLAALIGHAQAAGAKVVLVGDDRQLPAIDAGGIFAALTRRLTPIVLAENRRQHDPAERAALAALRAGMAEHALARLDRRGHVITTDDPAAAIVTDWLDHRRRRAPALMLAARRADVDDLNTLAQHALRRSGALAGKPLVVGRRRFHVGDQVIAEHNDYDLDIVNGDRAVITAIDEQRRSLTVRLTRDRTVRNLPTDYVRRHVRLGYAMTVHKAQGATTDHALVLADDALYNELGYTALSRGRRTNRLYVATATDDEHAHAAATVDPFERLRIALTRSRAKEAAHA